MKDRRKKRKIFCSERVKTIKETLSNETEFFRKIITVY